MRLVRFVGVALAVAAMSACSNDDITSPTSPSIAPSNANHSGYMLASGRTGDATTQQQKDAPTTDSTTTTSGTKITPTNCRTGYLVSVGKTCK